ncbi:hypothetical protein GCM10018952_25240 [Streptosporangium vulgare]
MDRPDGEWFDGVGLLCGGEWFGGVGSLCGGDWPGGAGPLDGGERFGGTGGAEAEQEPGQQEHGRSGGEPPEGDGDGAEPARLVEQRAGGAAGAPGGRRDGHVQQAPPYGDMRHGDLSR